MMTFFIIALMTGYNTYSGNYGFAAFEALLCLSLLATYIGQEINYTRYSIIDMLLMNEKMNFEREASRHHFLQANTPNGNQSLGH